jgi:hypothetical protein
MNILTFTQWEKASIAVGQSQQAADRKECEREHVQINENRVWTETTEMGGKICWGKAVLLQAWSSPEGFRKLRFPDYMTTAQDGGKVVSLTHPLPLRFSPFQFFSVSAIFAVWRAE